MRVVGDDRQRDIFWYGLTRFSLLTSPLTIGSLDGKCSLAKDNSTLLAVPQLVILVQKGFSRLIIF